ncbi:MAG TPA: TraB/GumN family protein [Caulobacteraceae bacterium]
MAALIAAIWFGFAGAATAKPAMWVVRDADSAIYLFGTVHMLRDDADWRTPLFDAVYDQAQTVWVETRLDAGQARVLMARYGVDPQRRLSDKLGPGVIQRLEPLLARRRIPLSSVETLRPWAAAMMLSVQPMRDHGYSLDKGADAVITRAADNEAKTVRTFETLEDQIRGFAELPEEAEVAYLVEVIDDQTRPPARGLGQAWAEGDLDGLGEEMVEDMRRTNPGLYDMLLRRRNEAWARELTVEMRGNGVELVNVGALHMIGPDGLPALMRARGYRVERVQ